MPFERLYCLVSYVSGDEFEPGIATGEILFKYEQGAIIGSSLPAGSARGN